MKNRKSKKKKFEDKLRMYIEKKDYVKIYRTGTEGDANISGVILQMSKDFLLIQVEEDFRLNGYVIIRRDRFDSIRLSKTEKFLRKVLEKEGILKTDLGLNHKISLESWRSIFRDLKGNDYFAIAECEDLKEPSFMIGEISKISAKAVGIKYFSPGGIFEKEPTKVKYKEITLVKFADRYTSMYRKYLKNENLN